MKIRLALTAVCLAAVAGGVPGTAHPDDEPMKQQNAQQSMTHDANASAQATTDMSYGGEPDTQSMSGGARVGKVCWPRAQCDVFFGH